MSKSYLEIDIADHVAHVRFNRPEKLNALHDRAWQELRDAFEALDSRSDVRVIVLSGEGRMFCAGIDVTQLMSLSQAIADDCEGRKRENFLKSVKFLQASVSSIEACRKPVLAAIHNGCIGGGVDITTACDMRYCTEDAYFSVREIDMGMVADIGTLQRLPKIVSPGMAREMAFTGRNVKAAEAQQIGLVNRVYADKETMLQGVFEIAAQIASKSPLSIRGTKEMLNFTRDHSVEEGLRYIATWNAAMILSDDLNEAFMSFMEKRAPVFKD